MIKEVHAIDFSNPRVNPTAQIGNFGDLVNLIGPIAMIIGALICLVMLLWGGFLYITSSGEPEKVQQAKRTFTYTIIGVLVMITATLFVNVLAYILGVNSFFKK